MPKMTIKSDAVVPTSRTVIRKEAVEIHAEVDCTLWFENGFGVGLKQDDKCYLAFDSDGHHHFNVDYRTPGAPRESVPVAQAYAGGGSVLTATPVMTASALSGPTGDIIV